MTDKRTPLACCGCRPVQRLFGGAGEGAESQQGAGAPSPMCVRVEHVLQQQRARQLQVGAAPYMIFSSYWPAARPFPSNKVSSPESVLLYHTLHLLLVCFNSSVLSLPKCGKGKPALVRRNTVDDKNELIACIETGNFAKAARIAAGELCGGVWRSWP